MPIIYCLTNESFKNNILYIGITTSFASLRELVDAVNDAFLPTPYTVILSTNINNNSHIDVVYSLLYKVGKHITGYFFEISEEIVKQIFDLIQNKTLEIMCNSDMCNSDMCNSESDICNSDIYENIPLQEKYRVVQDEIEYIIPKSNDCIYDNIIYNIPSALNKPYDRLHSFKSTASTNTNVINNHDIDL